LYSDVLLYLFLKVQILFIIHISFSFYSKTKVFFKSNQWLEWSERAYTSNIESKILFKK
jgi:hypothetical protein